MSRPSIPAIQKVQWDSTVLENQTLVFEAKIVRKSLTFFFLISISILSIYFE